MWTSCPQACIASPRALKGASVRSLTGRPSSSARTAMAVPAAGPTRAIRPVCATVVAGTGNARATAAAVSLLRVRELGVAVKPVAQLDGRRKLPIDAGEQLLEQLPQ